VYGLRKNSVYKMRQNSVSVHVEFFYEKIFISKNALILNRWSLKNYSPQLFSTRGTTSCFANHSAQLQRNCGVDCVRNDERKFCSCHNIPFVGTTLFFTMFLHNLCMYTPDFSVERNTIICETQHVCTLKMSPQSRTINKN
jgi:hypothetical protein